MKRININKVVLNMSTVILNYELINPAYGFKIKNDLEINHINKKKNSPL